MFSFGGLVWLVQWLMGVGFWGLALEAVSPALGLTEAGHSAAQEAHLMQLLAAVQTPHR